jgi:hypothetical protein
MTFQSSFHDNEGAPQAGITHTRSGFYDDNKRLYSSLPSSLLGLSVVLFLAYLLIFT